MNDEKKEVRARSAAELALKNRRFDTVLFAGILVTALICDPKVHWKIRNVFYLFQFNSRCFFDNVVSDRLQYLERFQSYKVSSSIDKYIRNRLMNARYNSLHVAMGHKSCLKVIKAFNASYIMRIGWFTYNAALHAIHTEIMYLKQWVVNGAIL